MFLRRRSWLHKGRSSIHTDIKWQNWPSECQVVKGKWLPATIMHYWVTSVRICFVGDHRFRIIHEKESEKLNPAVSQVFVLSVSPQWKVAWQWQVSVAGLIPRKDLGTRLHCCYSFSWTSPPLMGSLWSLDFITFVRYSDLPTS